MGYKKNNHHHTNQVVRVGDVIECHNFYYTSTEIVVGKTGTGEMIGLCIHAEDHQGNHKPDKEGERFVMYDSDTILTNKHVKLLGKLYGKKI